MQKLFLAVQSVLKLVEAPLVPSACCIYSSAPLEKRRDQETSWEHQGTVSLDSKPHYQAAHAPAVQTVAHLQ